MYYVYALTHPVTYDPFYVGRTGNPQKRMDDHIRSGHGNEPLHKYILTIINDGYDPVMDILYECETEEDAIAVEMEVINEYKDSFTLFNLQIKRSEVAKLRLARSQVSMCGIDGYYCQRSKTCSVCHEVERRYREDMLVNMLQDEDVLFYMYLNKSELNQIKRAIVKSGFSYLVIPQGNRISLVVSDCDFWTENRDSIEASVEDVVSLLTTEKNLFPNGKRSASGRWRFNTWRNSFSKWG